MSALLTRPLSCKTTHSIGSYFFHQVMKLQQRDDTYYLISDILWTNKHTPVYTHTNLTALFPGLPRWAGTRKGKPIWILLKHETVIGSGISWAMCKSAPCSRQITMSAPHHSVFYKPDALPATQPTASKHRRSTEQTNKETIKAKKTGVNSKFTYLYSFICYLTTLNSVLTLLLLWTCLSRFCWNFS